MWRERPYESRLLGISRIRWENKVLEDLENLGSWRQESVETHFRPDQNATGNCVKTGINKSKNKLNINTWYKWMFLCGVRFYVHKTNRSVATELHTNKALSILHYTKCKAHVSEFICAILSQQLQWLVKVSVTPTEHFLQVCYSVLPFCHTGWIHKRCRPPANKLFKQNQVPRQTWLECINSIWIVKSGINLVRDISPIDYTFAGIVGL